MKLTVQSFIDVEIDESQQRQVCINFLLKKFNWKLSYIVEEQSVLEIVTYSSSHSWTDKKFIRKAEDEDFLAYSVFKSLNSQNSKT